MNPPRLAEFEIAMVSDVFRRHPEVSSVTLFGSRAKGTASDRSDVDLAVRGDLTPLQAEAIAGELDELPLPYRFEVQPIARIRHQPLRDHIDRIGICIYRAE
ncbi:MAG: nucleotidyltransferase domain-containing protein [Planctomycetes bacterium]|nr:nucleotidyltransferase domain-containing protein [Planctomycetota bacterium]